MATRTVEVEHNGVTFRCSRVQYDRLWKPRGLKLAGQAQDKPKSTRSKNRKNQEQTNGED